MMKLSVILVVGALMLWALAANAFAQELSAREQFQAAVVAYQRTANDSSAVNIIQLYNRLESPPAVPKEARELFAMGVTAFKKSTDQAGFEKTLELFDKAIQVAPWWSEVRYNRAVVLETLGLFVAAVRDLNVYLAFKLTDSDRRETQDKIRELKAKADAARSKQSLDRRDGNSMRSGGTISNDGQSGGMDKRY